MNEYSTINDIVNTSIRNSSYISVVISSCVFLIYTVVIKMVEYYKSKSRSKPLIEMAMAIKENTTNILKLNQVLSKTIETATRKDEIRAKQVIELALNAFKSKIENQVIPIIVRNNIEENKEYVIDNIKRIINTSYYNMYSILVDYEVNDINIGSRLKSCWIDNVSNSVIDIVFNGHSKEERILQINTKLKLAADDYNSYIYNKVF